MDDSPTLQVKLFLDDVRDPPDRSWTHVRSVREAKALLAIGNVAFASLDHDLGMFEVEPGVYDEDRSAPTGYELCVWMAETGLWPKEKPTVHSQNPVGAAAMRQCIERYWKPPRARRPVRACEVCGNTDRTNRCARCWSRVWFEQRHLRCDYGRTYDLQCENVAAWSLRAPDRPGRIYFCEDHKPEDAVPLGV
jgi:hypothetical protein